MLLFEQIVYSVHRSLAGASPWLFAAAAILVVGGLVAACWEHGLLRKDFAAFRRLSASRRCVLTAFVVLAAYSAGTKGDGGRSNGAADAPRMMARPVLATPDADEDEIPVAEMFPVWTNAVTNLCVTGIRPASTTDYLRAHWPLPLTPGATGIEVYARPRLETDDWACIGEFSIPPGTNSTVVAVPHALLPFGWESSMFYLLGFNFDTDGDTLTDLYELLVSKTDPFLADTDGDGMPDGEENIRRTDPNLSDTDGDGILDIDEIGRIELSDHFEWYDTTGWMTVYGEPPSSGFYDYFGAYVDAPLLNFPVLPNAQVDGAMCFENGCLFLYKRGGVAGWIFPGWISPLSENPGGMGDVTVAPYWSSSYLPYGDSSSCLRTGIVSSNGCFVAEYRNVKLRGTSDARMTYQVIVPGGTGSVIRVSYLSSDVWMDGAGAVVGVKYNRVMTPDGCYNLTWDFAERGPILPLTTVEYRLGYGTDPTLGDTDGDGLGDLFELSVSHSVPWDRDVDGDGLGDADEYALGTDPNFSDSDKDGLPDGWEAESGLDPLSASEDGGWSGDPDGDGLTNFLEMNLGTSPVLSDTDDDGADDAVEVAQGTDPVNPDSDGDGLNDGTESGVGTDPLRRDTDFDGLDDALELRLGTDPRQPDSDGDGLDDGWESNFNGAVVVPPRPAGLLLSATPGTVVPFDPTVNNDEDEDPNNDSDEDPDDDGLTNSEECAAGTNPCVPDTDGDGVNDQDEVGQGSDPTDPSDEGDPNSREAVSFYFGDHSDSHSEKYRLEVTPLQGVGARPRSFSKINERYGQCETNTVYLVPGWSYEVRLDHAGTDPDYHDDPCPDYDYVLRFVVADSSLSVILDDPQGLFGGNDNSGESFTGEGKVAYLYVLGRPLLVFDYDRDGKIDDADVAKAKEGKVFRFWINDDNDSGDVCPATDYCGDVPGHFADYSNGSVDGRRDLLDFTPVWIDFSDVFPPSTPTQIVNGIEWRIESSCANAVWTDFSRADAGEFQKTDKRGCGLGLNQYLYEAATVALDGNGVMLPPDFLELAKDSEDKGVFLIEGRGGAAGLSIVGYGKLQNEVVRGDANVSMSPVERMYRWLNLRSSCGDASGLTSNTNSPINRPDSECDGRQFVFVHGFNVNTEEARASAAEVFKRLWQSGSDSMFTAVEWYGDQEQTDIIEDIRGTVSLNYYANAFHAFETAPDLVTACAALPGTNKVVIAHSLGNVLVSSAAVDWGLAYDRYYMLNAAVAMEAYDGTEYADDMIDSNWLWTTNGVYANWRASRWSGLFGPEDFRSTLSWKGRFAGITNAVNCYSTTEDVVGNPKEPSLSLTWTDWVLQQPVWVMQERVKGTLLVDVIDIWPWSHLGCEGGWGRNAHYPLWCTTGSTNGLSNITREAMIEHPLFTPFTSETEKMSSTNLFSVSDDSAGPPLRARFLADAIPAESHAAGANAFRKDIVDDNVRMDTSGDNGCMTNEDKWPERDNQKNPIWKHSAFKQIAYFFTYKLFDYFVKGK